MTRPIIHAYAFIGLTPCYQQLYVTGTMPENAPATKHVYQVVGTTGKHPLAYQLMDIICRVAGITREDILSDSRKRLFVDARRVLMVILERRGFGQEQTAAILGYANHTSVCSHLKHARNLMDNAEFRPLYDRCISTIQLVNDFKITTT